MAGNLPTWESVDKKYDALKTLDPLERFIHDWQPVGQLDELEFRTDLAGLVEWLRNEQKKDDDYWRSIPHG